VKKTALPAILVIFVLGLSFTACDDFFSSGQGSFRSYKVENIDVTAANIEEWLHRTVGNPDLAHQVTLAIIYKLEILPFNHPDRPVLLRYGVKIAAESSNLGVAILINALDILPDLADGDLTEEQMKEKLKDILKGIQDDFRNSGGVSAAESITKMTMFDVDLRGDYPTFRPGSFAHEASPSEVARTILVLALATVEESDVDIEDWQDFNLDQLTIGLSIDADTNRVVIDGDQSDEALVLAAYLNFIIADPSGKFADNFLTGAIRNAFFGS
jgi:hypothetical protein